MSLTHLRPDVFSMVLRGVFDSPRVDEIMTGDGMSHRTSACISGVEVAR